MNTLIRKTTKAKLLISLGLLMICTNSFAQTQMKKWFTNGKEIDFSTTTPTVSNSNAFLSGAKEGANAYYGPENNLLISVIDKNVYNRLGALIGTIANLDSDPLISQGYYYELGTELSIVPNPESACKVFLIYEVTWQNSGGSFYRVFNKYYYAEIDLTLNNGLGGFSALSSGPGGVYRDILIPVPVPTFQTHSVDHTYGSFVVGKKNQNSRNIFFVTGRRRFISGTNTINSHVYKATINAQGISNLSQIYSSSSIDLSNVEAELSHNNTMLAVGCNKHAGTISQTQDVVLFHLNSNGTVNNVSTYNLPGSNNIAVTGIEFNPNNLNIIVGVSGIGLYRLNLINSISTFITNSNNYGNSQIELAYNGYMYAANSQDALRAIDFDATIPLLLPTIDNNNVNLQSNSIIRNQYPHTSYGNNIYTLPQQIDGQNYEDFFEELEPECCRAVAKYDKFSYTATQSATWTATSNPLNNGTGSVAYIKDELFIPDGISITIVGMTIYFSDLAKVIVENGSGSYSTGGRLTLDNTTFTLDPKCDAEHLWNGVEVWGTTNQSQLLGKYHGRLTLENNSEISYAGNAVTLWKYLDYTKSGGVIYCTNSTFKNNRRSIEFISYQNFHPTTLAPMNNISSINFTDFYVDDDYIDVGSEFYAHATLWNVDGVRFRACNFENRQSSPVLLGTEFRNMGIHSIDAGYEVLQQCSVFSLPCLPQNLLPSSFQDLYLGIYATGTGFFSSVSASNSVFENNLIGYTVDNVDQFSSFENNFLIGGSSNYTSFPHIGLNSVESTGYNISGNSFSYSSAQTATPHGLRIFNSGENNNLVTSNIYNDMSVAQSAIGINKSNFVLFDGLRFICNEHYNSDVTDILVGTSSSNEGISSLQGSFDSGFNLFSAGNIFSQPGNSTNGHINNSSSLINYIHNGGNTEPVHISAGVNVIFGNANTTCGAIPFMQHPLSENEKELLYEEISFAEEETTNLYLSYKQLIDGGNTEELINLIQSTWSEDVWNLRTELLEISPYLSYDVLKAVVDRNVLPHAMLLEICLANPEVTMINDFTSYLKENMLNPLPDYMIDMIKENWSVQSSRTTIEANLSNISSKKNYAINTLIRELMTDSVKNISEIRDLLVRRGSMRDYYALSEHYMLSGDFETSENILSEIPSKFEFQAHDINNHEEYMQFFSFLKSIHNDNRKIAQLSEAEQDELEKFTESSSTKVSSRAWNISCFFYDKCKPLNLEIPTSKTQFKMSPPNPSSVINAAYNQVDIYPNPANTFTTLKWKLPALEGSAQLLIKDLTGKVVTSTSISGVEGQWIWDTRDMNNGMFIFEIQKDGIQLKTGKIVVSN